MGWVGGGQEGCHQTNAGLSDVRISNFRVEKYRSIVSSESMELGDLTTLVGPNNEGKSNILRSMVVGLRVINQLARARSTPNSAGRISLRSDSDFEAYDWERDFPKQLQPKTPNASSVFEFTFELTEDEIAQFNSEVRSSINGFLKIRLLVFSEGRIELKILKPGRGSVSLNKKATAVAKFVSSRIEVLYIPAARTSEQSMEIIERLVVQQLRSLDRDEDYLAAVAVVQAARTKALEPVGQALKVALSRFLPDVSSVSIVPSDNRLVRFGMRGAIDVVVDDGTPTLLSAKGDGVQSLAAISLARHSVRSGTAGRSILIALEEPEAHLHPGAIHGLRDVLSDISGSEQVVLTTHSPLLVNRTQASRNVLVSDNRAKAAGSLAEIREMLGVRSQDNLRTADVVVIVEGEFDRIVLGELLSRDSPVLKSAFADGRLAINLMVGCGNASYHFRHFVDSLHKVHVVLDNDEAGRRAHLALQEEPAFQDAAVTLLSVANHPNSELEDLFDPSCYRDALLSKFNVDVDKCSEPSRFKCFSDRMKETFVGQGQPWTKAKETLVKSAVATSVVDSDSPLLTDRSGPIDAISRRLAILLE